ncbi:MAG: hypothetical protein ACTSXD_06850 [Candidatus Heimdallarchaeaceae archaeon]
MLYRGKVIKDFLIDQLAMGLPYQQIVKNYENLYGMQISVRDIELICGGLDSDIKKREKEILEETKKQASSTRSKLQKLVDIGYDKIVEAYEHNKLKVAATHLTPILKAIEMDLKLLGQLSDNTEVDKKANAEESYNILLSLADKNLISLNNEDELRKIFGLSKENDYVKP